MARSIRPHHLRRRRSHAVHLLLPRRRGRTLPPRQRERLRTRRRRILPARSRLAHRPISAPIPLSSPISMMPSRKSSPLPDGSGIEFAQAEPARNSVHGPANAFELHLDFVPQSKPGNASDPDAARQRQQIADERERFGKSQLDEIVALIRSHLDSNGIRPRAGEKIPHRRPRSRSHRARSHRLRSARSRNSLPRRRT